MKDTPRKSNKSVEYLRALELKVLKQTPLIRTSDILEQHLWWHAHQEDQKLFYFL